MSDQTPDGYDDDGAEQDSTHSVENDNARSSGGSEGLRKRGLLIGLAAVVAIGVVAGGVVWLNNGKDTGDSRAFKRENVSSIVSKFPEGTQVIKGERTMDRSDVGSISTGDDFAIVTPTNCQGKQKVDRSRLVGATANTVNASIKGVLYVVTAQEIPSGNAPRVRKDKDCERMSISYPDGSYNIVSPAEGPRIDGFDVEGARSVTRTSAEETVDNFVFTAWMDDYHAVVVTASSDPTYKPQANPIDPKMAKELLTEAVRLVTTG